MAGDQHPLSRIDEEADEFLLKLRRTRASAWWSDIAVQDCSGLGRDLIDDLQWMDEEATGFAKSVKLLAEQARIKPLPAEDVRNLVALVSALRVFMEKFNAPRNQLFNNGFAQLAYENGNTFSFLSPMPEGLLGKAVDC